MSAKLTVPIQTLHLFLPLEQKLIELLKSLSEDEWQTFTLARKWTVKDVAAHLLDGSIRTLAAADNYEGDPPGTIQSYQDLLDYLNRHNAEWVHAMKRVSPATLIHLLEVTQKPFVEYYQSLDPYGQSRYSVAWAGEETSLNWFHIAREYTERWHHQQQIREAVQQPGTMIREFFYPVMQTFMMALPHAYRNTVAPEGTRIRIIIEGETGGNWCIQSNGHSWFLKPWEVLVTTEVSIPPDIAWKLFTKGTKGEVAVNEITITGDSELAKPLLNMVAVMA